MIKKVDSPELTSLEKFQANQVGDWEVYVATEAIDINQARAFNPGDAVPASHVTRGVVRLDQVMMRSEASQAESSAPRVATPVLRGSDDIGVEDK